MPVFAYRAIRTDGQRTNASIEAPSMEEAKRLLREQQFIILSLRELPPSDKNVLHLSFEQRVIFASQLAQLLEANVPLYESLEALEEQAGASQPIIAALREHIRKGASFSKALSWYPDTFSPLFRAIVSAGESVGRLDQALIRLSQLLSTERSSRQRLISALLYPCLLLVLLVASFFVLAFFVVPSIEGLFEGHPLPTYTWLIFSCANFLHHHAFLLGTLFVLLIGGLIFQLSKRSVREKFVKSLLSWPYIGQYLIKSSLARFCLTLSHLLAGGTPLSSALEFAKESLNNAILAAEIERATKEIIEGQRLSSSLRQSPILPPLLARMVHIGEETGRLAPVLANLARLYEEDSERLLERSVSLIQPIMLLTIGIVIGGTLLAILLPLAHFGSFINM